jgi:hypothetical protein
VRGQQCVQRHQGPRRRRRPNSGQRESWLLCWGQEQGFLLVNDAMFVFTTDKSPIQKLCQKQRGCIHTHGGNFSLGDRWSARGRSVELSQYTRRHLSSRGTAGDRRKRAMRTAVLSELVRATPAYGT